MMPITRSTDQAEATARTRAPASQAAITPTSRKPEETSWAGASDMDPELRLDGWPGSARRRCFAAAGLAHGRIEAAQPRMLTARLLKARVAARLASSQLAGKALRC